jgi:hypothetical protein
MSAALRTRDGSFSTVAMLHASEDARLGVIEVDADQAVEWARANRVDMVPGEGAGAQMARINAARREYVLPVMVLRGRAQQARPKATSVGISHTDLPKAGAAKCPSGLHSNLGISQDEGVAPDHPLRATIAQTCPEVRIKPGPLGGVTSGDPIDDQKAAPPSGPPIAATQDELLALVTDHDGTRTGVVTPEVAGWLLALNTGNRPLLLAAVNRFIRILRTGQWMLTGEPIIVSREGVLSDGQHRLEAVARSGLPAMMDVRFGIDRAAFAATGTGTRRTAGQALAIAGGSHSSTQAAIARLLHWFDAEQMPRCSMQVEPGEVIRIVEANPQILQVAGLQKKCRFAPARTAPIGLVLAVAARKAPLDRVAAFLAVLDTGLADDEANAARRLHVRLRDAAMSKERISQIDAAALTARAWNAWHAGRTVQQLRVGERDRTGEGFPEVMA